MFVGIGKKRCSWGGSGLLVCISFRIHSCTDRVGIGAISYVEYARRLFPGPGKSDYEINQLTAVMRPGMHLSLTEERTIDADRLDSSILARAILDYYTWPLRPRAQRLLQAAQSASCPRRPSGGSPSFI